VVVGEVDASAEACTQKGEVPFGGRDPRGHMNIDQGTARQQAIDRRWGVVRPSRRAALVGKAFSASAGQVPSSGHLPCMR
jgi:hypothetical protein